jgi:hypothetical protein
MPPRSAAAFCGSCPEDSADSRIRELIAGLPAASYSLASNPALMELSRAISSSGTCRPSAWSMRTGARPYPPGTVDRLEAMRAAAAAHVEADGNGQRRAAVNASADPRASPRPGARQRMAAAHRVVGHGD